MTPTAGPDKDYKAIQALIDGGDGDGDRFAERLRQSGLAHISFSQVATVEACQYRYFLQYVRFMEPDPVPDYFTKGKLLHEMIACSYKGTARGQAVDADGMVTLAGAGLAEDHQRHLRNALAVHLENRWEACEVVGIEKPFVMMLGAGIPPCVGVIDLILKKDGKYILVDHKTGRDFYPDDELQMGIYVEYLRRTFGDAQCEFYYEHYRWVNNLRRIRKPAFKRVPVSLQGAAWENALDRIRRGSALMDAIKAGKRPARNGECFRCPYRRNCWG